MSSITINDDLDFMLFNSEEGFFKVFPKPNGIGYRPQPSSLPERYPVLAIEVDFITRENGPDERVMFYVYNFKING